MNGESKGYVERTNNVKQENIKETMITSQNVYKSVENNEEGLLI
jgi:hypothetical protein